MTEITDLSVTDSSNTSVTGESLDGSIANMGRMDNTLQAVMGLLARSIRTNVFRIIDNTDSTKRMALDLSGLSASTTRTVKAPASDGTMAVVSSTNGDLTLTYTDAGAAGGPGIITFRDSASPAVSDSLGFILFRGRDSAANIQDYASIGTTITDPVSGTEDGNMLFSVFINGVSTNVLTLSSLGASGSSFRATSALTSGTFSGTGVTAGWSTATGQTSSSNTGTGGFEQYRFNNANGQVGNIATSGATTTYNTTSDERLKDNFRDFDAGPIIDSLGIGQFDWIVGGSAYGVLAQQAHKVFPDAVSVGDSKHEFGDDEFKAWSVDYSKYVPLLLKEVQELRKRLKAAGL